MQNSNIQWLKTRRSIRRYKPEPVATEIVDQILQTAVWAPSAHNRQPWRFVVMEQQATKIKLASAMGAKLRVDLTADGMPPELIKKDAERSFQRITNAPILILLCLTMADMDSYPDSMRQANEKMMAVQSVALAGQNLLLAAHSFGLGACWMCAPLFCPQVVVDTLQMPSDWEPQALISVGYPAESKEKTRHSLEGRVLWR